MSVPNQTPYIIYNANGLTTVFPFEFYIINAADLQVSINGTTVTSGYSVSGTGNVGGGDVTFITPPASGSVVMLERVVPTYRLTDYQDNGDLLADTVNKDFDRLWMAIQRSFIYLGLALRRPLLGGPYNAEGYRISRGADPVDQQDFATKNYVDNVSIVRALRVPDSFVPEMPPLAQMEGKLIAIAGGRPVGVLPPSGSASEVLTLLASKDGYSLIGEVQSISGFYGMTGATGKKVRLKGWYAGSTIGGGEFYFDATIAKSKHDGGKYISPTIPYTTASAFVSGTGETDASGSGVWVRSGIADALRGEWYGMISGIDVTTMSQKMANTAGVDGYGLIWPLGNMRISGTVNILCDNSLSGQVKFLRGAGKRGTSLVIDVSTSPSVVGLVVIGSIGKATQTQDMLVVEGLTIIGNGTGPAINDKTGTGLYLQDIFGLRLIDLDFKNLERGCLIQNSIYIYGASSRFESCQTGLLCRRNGLVTGANAVELVRCDFTDNVFYGLQGIESHAFKLSNCAFEANGRTTFHGQTVTPVAAVQFSEGGGAGGNIAVFDTCYFEANIMPDIKYKSSSDRVQMITVKNSILSNTRDNVTQPHILFQTSSAGLSSGSKYILEMQGNTFYNGKPLEATPRPNVVINGFASLGYGKADFLNYNNYFYGAVKIDAIVAHKKSSDDGFICRGLSAGGFTAASSRNVITCTRQTTGTYRIVTNQLTNALTFQVQLDNLGFANISTAENNEALTITTYNQSGALADVNFMVIGKMV
ncbi:phage tail fiber domain-containing protein [Enterobacter sichuanensis]|uniref:phage tail fiber domain-containing protein n=1 Tax=Enterobacter sichuanensis TaxID=2071710 RepID=UPI002813AAF1|nr:phage tail fiber protein [Enterobacter sichuanensis]MDR0174234.1 phage tail fiber protein [Enterobacter sichuanensis]